jgi:small subunit ribosomal protein S2
MLTNWKTISNSIKKMREIETLFETGEVNALTKKEQLSMQRQLDKMRMTFDGIRDMGGLPDILVVIDSNKEYLAIAEANVLKIPVVAVLDSNSNPDGIAYPIPGNDDALRAIALYCEYLTNAVLDGIQVEMAASGGDMGAAEDLSDAVSNLPPAEEASDSEAALPDASVNAPLQSGDEAEEADKVAEEATEAQAEATPPEAKTGPATTAKKPAPKKPAAKKPAAKKPAAKAAPASASDAKPVAKKASTTKASTRNTTEAAGDADAGADDKPAAKPKRSTAKTGSKAAASKPSAT